jgi:hypothetical protein
MVRGSIRVCVSLLVLCSYLPLFAQQAGDNAKTPSGSGANGTTNFIARWTSTTALGNANLFQNATSQIGIGTTTPVALLDVKGTEDVRDTLTLFPIGTHPALTLNGTALKVSNTGLVTFIAGQTFPGTGTVTSIAAGAGLAGGTITHTGTLSIKAAGVTNAMLQNSKITLNANAAGGLTAPGAMTLGGTSTIGLKPCAATQVLQFSGTVWNCSNAGTGTITGVTTAATSGLAGGGTSGTLNLSIATGGVTNTMLQHNSLTVTAGTGLSGGGAIALGGSATLNNTGVLSIGVGSGITTTGGQNPTLAIDTSVVPTLSGVNFFSGFSDFDGSEPQWEVEVSNSSTGDAIIASNTSVDSSHPTLSLTNNDSTSAGDLILDAFGPSFGGECSIDVTGNLFCTGTLGAVTKAGSTLKVGVYGVQSPENWIEDFGSGALFGGVTTINLEPTFAKTISTSKADYHVFLTPAGDCEGLYVANRTATSFEVRELKRGTSNVAFDYRIVAHRKGLESARLPVLKMGNAKAPAQQAGHLAGSR